MVFWKTSEVTKEELRLQKLEEAFKAGKLSVQQYTDSINKLKMTGEGASSPRSANALDIVQMLLVVAVIGAGVYALKVIKS